MRSLAVILCLATVGCSESPMVIGGGEPGIFQEPTDFCLRVSPETLTMTASVGQDARESAEVELAVAEDCFNPFAEIVDIRLDDPAGAFELGDWEPGPVEVGEPMTLEVRLGASEVGIYEAQLLVEGVTMGPPTVRAGQLFGEVVQIEE